MYSCWWARRRRAFFRLRLPLWLSGQPPLEGGELLLCFLQVLGVIVLLTIRGDDQILDAHIKADSGASAEQLGDIYLVQHRFTKNFPLRLILTVALRIRPCTGVETLAFTHPSLGSLTALSVA